MKWKQCFIRHLRVLRLNRYSLTDSCDTMSEQDNKPKQRRNVGDKMKDLYNTYVRNEEMAEHETSKTEQSASDTTEQEVAMAENVADDTVARLTKERDELREQLVRQVAELDNYRRRSLKEKDELREYANQHLLLKMLPIIDDLHAALDVAAKSTHDAIGFQKGVEMIYHKAVKIFEDAGVVNPLMWKCTKHWRNCLRRCRKDMFPNWCNAVIICAIRCYVMQKSLPPQAHNNHIPFIAFV